MRNIILTIAIALFIVGVTLQFICTLHQISLLCLAQSALLLILIKDNRKMKKDKCNGTCEHCECKVDKDEQHHKT